MLRLFFLVLFFTAALVSPAAALFTGIIFALVFKHPYLTLSKKVSKYLLQVAVVGLGFGMNLHQSLEAGREGMLFTIVSVAGVMLVGCLIGRRLNVSKKLAYLISSGTAICGGSAIAAIAPVVDADDNETSVSLAVVFTLNALALFVFPPVGHLLNMTQQQFGLWAAMAIHDTSSVVGAGASYGAEALAVATTVKLTRALWIIPLSLVSMFLFGKSGSRKAPIQWFILFFIVAMLANTYLSIPRPLLDMISLGSHMFLSMTLFLIGSSLSVSTIKAVGLKPVLLGVILWILISFVVLIVIL
ncbi:MAG: putative sulfate exporter family transporter [Tannerellaceae bacterium]|jgi:uncharacterized integral membrane protein (TIGR00698 family)|nr:putative sulfate exporter family transporter [Tannerellaceae bacterium]